MTVGTVGFVPERLSQAREARSLSVVALADLVGVSASAISQYEKGVHDPKPEVTRKLADKLNLPVAFFLKERTVNLGNVYWRSISAATKQSRKRARRRLEWLIEITEYLEQFLDFPELNLPDFDLPSDHRSINSLEIESLAEQVRDIWSLGKGPVANVVRTLESNGIFVTRGSLDAETLDGLSESGSDRPFVFLSSDKCSLARSRFDAAHELGHLILHRNVPPISLNKSSDHKQIEDQAHLFAAAFLLPGKEFADELFAPTLDGFRSLKYRWNVSVAAMIMRTKQLGIIDDRETKRLWINLSRRGWRKKEPLDDLPPEVPTMLSKAVKLLVDNCIKSREQVLADLALSAFDAEELIGLKPGYFGQSNRPTDPQLKANTKVVEFRRS